MQSKITILGFAALAVVACGDDSTGPRETASGAAGGAAGGTEASGGGGDASTGGAVDLAGAPLGGATRTGGGAGEATGGAATGGNSPSGGSGGEPSSGGSSTGGSTSTGGTTTGGSSPTGGSATGGSLPTGGGATGGSSPAGGTPTGGTPTGGVPTGGAGADGGATSSGGADGSGGAAPTGLSWPIDCIPGDTCVNLDAPDIDGDGVAYDCGAPGYTGHEGTDIGITWTQMDAGTAVRAAADGEVFFASDGKYDRCPNDAEPDCQRPAEYLPGDATGTNVCTELGPYCGTGGGSCFWCFAGGNVIVILHEGVPGVFATRYDHLANGSVLVDPGERVVRGQVIAHVGSAGNSTGPHLHFEVWGTGYYELADPWAGACGPNTGPSLWAYDPPWQ
jgi:murein DD-endopeptidase MepM/ murein hydrolase activator NlpD